MKKLIYLLVLCGFLIVVFIISEVVLGDVMLYLGISNLDVKEL